MPILQNEKHCNFAINVVINVVINVLINVVNYVGIKKLIPGLRDQF